MAYNSSPGRAEYVADAAQTNFPFSFKIFSETDIKVYQTPVGNNPNDVDDLLTYTTDYTVTINGDLGGEVNLVSGATSGDAVTLVRDLPVQRDIEYQTSGDLLASTLNTDLNYNTYLTADREQISSRNISIPVSAQNVSTELPDVSGDAYIKWNATGDALENDTTLPDSVVTTNANVAAAALSEANAATSEANAATSEANALSSKNFANKWATESEDTLVNDGVHTPAYSAFHYAQKAIAAQTLKSSARNTVLAPSTSGVHALATTPTQSFGTRTYRGNGASLDVPMGIGDGAEELTNGDFETGDLTGWTDASTGTGTATVVSGDLVLTRGATSGDIPLVTQTITTVIGDSYEITCLSSDTDEYRIKLDGGADILGDGIGNQTVAFRATATSHSIELQNTVNSTTVTIQSISVKEITKPIKSYDPNWVSGRAYSLANEQDAYCIHNYYIYRLLADVTSATTPDADPTNWEVVADGVSVPWFNSQVWVKSRSEGVTLYTGSHVLMDTLRGSVSMLQSDTTSAELLSAQYVSSFNIDGFSVGSNNRVNYSGHSFVAWQEQFDTMVSGTTNQGKRYITAYNAQSGKFMGIMVGSGTAGHEIPHGVGTKPDFIMSKSRTNITAWRCYNSYSTADEEQRLDDNSASVASATWNNTEPTDSIFTLGTSNNNTLDADIVFYGSSNRDNHTVTKMYQGTGAAGNVVPLGLDMTQAGAKVMIKQLSSGTLTSWLIADNIRGGSAYLYADLSNAEATGVVLEFTSSGVTIQGTGAAINTAGAAYLIEATVPNYDKPNGGLNRPAGNILSFAEGVDGTTGDLDSIETSTSVDYSLTAGAKNWLFADKGNTLSASTVKMLKGLDRVSADKWGVESPSDATLKTTDKHSDYASATGVVSASNEEAAGNTPPWHTLDKDYSSAWVSLLSASTADIIYVLSEERKLVSYTIAPQIGFETRNPKSFTMNVSSDGVNYTTVDTQTLASSPTEKATYTLSVPSDAKYIKLSMTAKDDASYFSIAELELNTEHPAGDFHDVNTGTTYDSTDTPTSRIPTGSIVTDGEGHVIPDTLETLRKTNDFVDAEVHGDLTVHGGFDLGQTWVNETANRLPDVTYKNETGKPMIVSVRITSTAIHGARIDIDDNVQTWDTKLAGEYSRVYAEIPPYSTYGVRVSSGTATVTQWAEYK